jgi:tetratricopeptide (TPR) repeat protein
VALFATDSVLFEVAYFMLVHICYWLNAEHPEFAKPVGQCFDDELFHVFTQALQIDNLGKLVDQRTAMYREFRQSDDYLGNVRHHLYQLILRTSDNQKPQPYDPAHHTVLFGSFFTHTDLMIHFNSWMHGFVSILESYDSNSELWDGLRNLLRSRNAQAEVQLHPLESWAWDDLGIAYAIRGEYDDATAAFHQAIKLEPDDADTWHSLGHCYQEQAKYDDAIIAYREATKLIPSWDGAWRSLGHCYQEQGRYDDAIRAYREAVNLKPDYSDAWFALGVTYREQGKRSEALDALDHLRKLDSAMADKLANVLAGK